MNFSRRTSWDLAENDLAAAVRAHRDAGRELLDLTVANPTHCGFHYDEAALLAPLGMPDALHYDPAPLGMASARAAVAAYYADHGARIPLDRICLTTSTSEAYSFLFRLLCDPGDEVLVASPSYPLFEYIAQLDDVQLRQYPLFYDPSYDPALGLGTTHGWAIDLHALSEAITPRTRAIVVVHPNNPTGNLVAAAEREALEQLCAAHDLALIADEVFLDYTLAASPPRSFAAAGNAGVPACLTFTLSGVSKVCGLPQMKVSWLVCTGPAALASAAMARVEVIADTFLSMNAPVQQALPAWLGGRHEIQQQIRARMTQNLDVLDRRLAGTSARRLAMQGGWTAVVQVPRTGVRFEEAALDHGVLVQPGDFYGLPEARVVLSLLTPPDTWARGLANLPFA